MTNVISSDEFRLLDLNEIDVVSGAAPGDCKGKVTTLTIKGKGTLDMGFEECEGLPGVKLPWAVWTPGGTK
jgi:hypothetical protein